MKISARKIIDYTKPRRSLNPAEDTSGDQPVLRNGPGVIAGGIQGYMMGKIPGAIGGTIGSFVGTSLGKKTDSVALKSAAGALTGAALSAATTAGLAAISGQGAAVPALVMSAVVGGLSGLTGTLAAEKGGNGVMSGGIQGFLVNKTVGAASGSLGGYVGVRVGEKTGSTETAMLAGAATGAALGAAAAAGLGLLAGQTPNLRILGGSALLGGFAGTVGTLTGSKRAAPRDGVYGGMLAGMVGATYTGNPALGIATAAASGYAARAKTPLGQAVVGTVLGAAAGGIAGAPMGWSAVAVNALAGAVATPLGSIVGTTARQVMRNAQVDLVNGINKKWIDPMLEKRKLSHTEKVLVGAAAGGIMLGTVGMVGGWKGAAIMGTVGLAAGAFQTDKIIKTVKMERAMHRARVENASIPGTFDRVLEEQQRILEEAGVA